MHKCSLPILLLLGACIPLHKAHAYDVGKTVTINGVLSGVMQCQDLSPGTNGNNTCAGSVPFQPTLTYRPTDTSTLYLKLGFASGNGLYDQSPFVIPPWGADLKDDVKNINGSGRDHLLEAWYEKVFIFDDDTSLALTMGILDATRYLDQNTYANDEYRQFMNPALSNAPNALLPSYDPGIAIEWYLDRWTFSAVWMDVHQHTSDDKYKFYGLQAGYTLYTRLGTGNYRVLLKSDRNLVDQIGNSKQKNNILIFSFDQEFGHTIGGFMRIGWRLDDQPINYHAVSTAGIDIKGNAWGRSLDNIGIAYAYLSGGSRNILRSQVAEAYYRLAFDHQLALTADIQYMQDEKIQGGNPSGWIYSLRATYEF